MPIHTGVVEDCFVMGMIMILRWGAARGATVLGVAALRTATTVIRATSSTTMLVFE